MTKLNKIEGLGAVMAQKLAMQNIKTLEDVLAICKTSDDRRALARKLGVTTRHVDHLVALADLSRVSGIDQKYAELLFAAHVKSVTELANCQPVELHGQLEMINSGRRRVKRVPAVSRVEGWVQKAQKLPTVISSVMV